jgi:hypothetical protein
MELRLGRLSDRRGGGAGDVSHEVYPPRLLTVVRERCSAGGCAHSRILPRNMRLDFKPRGLSLHVYTGKHEFSFRESSGHLQSPWIHLDARR